MYSTKNHDYGTHEAQLKRTALVVNRFTGEVGDVTNADTALGQMAEQGFLHPDPPTARRMKDAGDTFLMLWRAVFPDKSQCTLARFQPSSNGEIDLQRATDDLRSLRLHLGQKPLYEALIDTVAYNKWPKQTTVKYSDSFINLRMALNRVMQWQRGRK